MSNTWSTYPSQKAFKQWLPLQVKYKSNYREEKAHFNPGNSIKQHKNYIFLHLPGKKRPFDSQLLYGKSFMDRV